MSAVAKSALRVITGYPEVTHRILHSYRYAIGVINARPRSPKTGFLSNPKAR